MVRTRPPHRKEPSPEHEPDPAAPHDVGARPSQARHRPLPPDAIDARPDAELVALAQRDRLAFDALFRRYQIPIFRFCYSLLGDRDAAADASQTTFLKAMEGIGRCRDGAAFEAWLFRIAHNVVNDDYRSRRNIAPWDEDEAAAIEDGRASPEMLAIDAERRRMLRSLFAQLGPADRHLIGLRLNGLNDKQIAEVLHQAHGTVRNKQSRLLGRLRSKLAAAGWTREGGPH